MAQGRAKRKVRVCVLSGRMEWRPPLPGRECLDRIHSHMTIEKAAALVDEGSAEWLYIERFRRSGAYRVRQNAIRMLPRRRWVARISDHGGAAPMKVMQLVP